MRKEKLRAKAMSSNAYRLFLDELKEENHEQQF